MRKIEREFELGPIDRTADERKADGEAVRLLVLRPREPPRGTEHPLDYFWALIIETPSDGEWQISIPEDLARDIMERPAIRLVRDNT